MKKSMKRKTINLGMYEYWDRMDNLFDRHLYVVETDGLGVYSSVAAFIDRSDALKYADDYEKRFTSEKVKVYRCKSKWISYREENRKKK